MVNLTSSHCLDHFFVFDQLFFGPFQVFSTLSEHCHKVCLFLTK
uniref:Uncharacterized protein n=1 Tax=Rhizophora mucronata TaxID=61149 RepID=A0A2P2QUI5_RHIMU